jgi:uncharacterized protein YjbJ (UPF0337 family)
VRAVTGKLTGDRQTEAEGKAQKAAGKMRREVGKAKDAIRDTFKK